MNKMATGEKRKLKKAAKPRREDDYKERQMAWRHVSALKESSVRGMDGNIRSGETDAVAGDNDGGGVNERRQGRGRRSGG